MPDLPHTLAFDMDDAGLEMYERIKRLADTDDSTLIIKALSLYWDMLRVVARDGRILVWEKGRKKPQVLTLP